MAEGVCMKVLIPRMAAVALSAAVVTLAFGTVAARADSTQWALFSPPEQHFSIQFPPNPAESDSTQNGNLLHQWIVRASDYTYLAQHLISGAGPLQASQLEGDLNDFLTGTKATLLSRANQLWRSPDGSAHALQFSFRMTDGRLGEAVFIVDGTNGFGAMIVQHAAAAENAEMVQFVNSFTILP
jgi:hypothetical protein